MSKQALDSLIKAISTQMLETGIEMRKTTSAGGPFTYPTYDRRTVRTLKDLPSLLPTDVVEPDFMRNADGTFKRDKKGKKYSRVHWMSRNMKSGERWKLRSETYQGIANAMANQWGTFLSNSNKAKES